MVPLLLVIVTVLSFLENDEPVIENVTVPLELEIMLAVSDRVICSSNSVIVVAADGIAIMATIAVTRVSKTRIFANLLFIF